MTNGNGLDRRTLTFEQAEGVEPLPQQLKPGEVSPRLRARLWMVFHASMMKSLKYPEVYGDPGAYFADPWSTILREKHILRDDQMVDTFNPGIKALLPTVKHIFEHGNYVVLLGFVQWVLRHRLKPHQLEASVAAALKSSHAAYILIGKDTIAPIASPSEEVAVQKAFADMAASEFNGARAHLRNAAAALTEGRFADSIRESIHAVESVSRILEPTTSTLAPALARLEKSARIHPALKAGFGSLYGFTSDEGGIRHALTTDSAAAVDETDALYMFGSCAAFVSYLIARGRSAGLVSS